MRPSILVVEDNVAIRSLLQEALEDEGYHVDTAEDGSCALRQIKQHARPYDVILLDLVLPHLHGLHVLEYLQQHTQSWITSVIVQSADIRALRQARREGLRYCLPKPFDLNMLLDLISELCVPLTVGKTG